MLKKIKNIINGLRQQLADIKIQNSELEWANIYHDTIRGRKWLNELSLSPGRWAGNYSLFYILIRILIDYKSPKIIEFGLGESSKIISSFIDNEMPNSEHFIVEHDINWMNYFTSKFNLSNKSKIFQLDLEKKKINTFDINGYKNIQTEIDEVFDLYLIDGPFGSEHYSRHDILLLAEKIPQDHEFIIIIDDYNRPGEKETADKLIGYLLSRGLSISTGIYYGAKAQIVIATEKYKYVTSL